MSKDGLGGFHQHTTAVGELLTSMYRIGSPDARNGPDDPSPGIDSMRTVTEQLDTSGFTHVISLDQNQGLVLCQSKCRLITLAKVLRDHSLRLDLPPALLKTTAGAAVLRGQIPADRVEWVEVLSAQGRITRHQLGQLPPDSFLLALCLRLDD